jgi:Mg-chelatase subunit ChlD
MLAEVLPSLGADDVVGAVAFAAHAVVVASPGAAAVRPLAALLPDATVPMLDPDDTDLGAAVATATALCPEGKQPAVLLATDGNETTGRVLAETALAGTPVPVFPVLPSTSGMPRVVMRRLLAPDTAPAGLFVPVEAVVEASAPSSVAIALAADDGGPPPRPVKLPAGLSVVALPYRAGEPGTRRLEARVLPTPGGGAAGVARATLEVTRPIRVLWLTERDAPPVAVSALVERGVDVTVVAPDALAARPGRLADADVAVLDDLAHRVLADATARTLERWVAGGGSLIVTGGEHLFGDAGFAGGPLERMLPVELVSQRPEPEEREPLALELVIDRSNSMGAGGADGITKMDYARRAALAVLEQLAPGDVAGAIAFDEAPHELAPPGEVTVERAGLAAQIRQLRAGGGTDFLDALDLARRRLLEVGGRVRHVILLTDGDTNRRTPDHYPEIEDLLRADVSVTTLRIGADVGNLELLGTIARATGGEFHHVERLETLPQLLIHDTQEQRAASSGRRGARVRLVGWGPMLSGIVEREIPPVARWARTRPRPDAEVRLAVEAGSRRDPLLVTWGWRLGRVAVLPLDFQSGGASWAVWRDFGKLWTQLVRWGVPRRSGAAGTSGGVAREGRATTVNRPLLDALAAATGGRVDPTPNDVLRARDGRAHETRRLDGWLLPLVMALVLADVALRRRATY